LRAIEIVEGMQHGLVEGLRQTILRGCVHRLEL
jgi:hypothetical protein